MVWVGFDDNQPLGLSGSQAALPIWTEFMKAAVAGRTNVQFEVPEGITFVEIDHDTGKLARRPAPTFTESFIVGTEPVDLRARASLLPQPVPFPPPVVVHFRRCLAIVDYTDVPTPDGVPPVLRLHQLDRLPLGRCRRLDLHAPSRDRFRRPGVVVVVKLMTALKTATAAEKGRFEKSGPGRASSRPAVAWLI